MVKGINKILSDLNGGDAQAGGDVPVTNSDSDSPGSQYRLETNDRADTDSASVPASDPPLSIDQVFEILKNKRRRCVLEYLTTVDEQVRLGELAERIAAWEYEKDMRAITSQERKRVYVGLYQCHLPKMDDVGAISYNKPRGKIEAGENIEDFQRYLPTETRDSAESAGSGTIQSVVERVFPFFERE